MNRTWAICLALSLVACSDDSVTVPDPRRSDRPGQLDTGIGSPDAPLADNGQPNVDTSPTTDKSQTTDTSPTTDVVKSDTTPASPDEDGDGYTVAAGDCDDNNPAVHPGAVEVCNGIDDDCANGIDDGVKITFYIDNDKDNFGVDNAATNILACEPPTGYAAKAGDCDDNDAFVFPGNPEVCDGKDNDCANGVDDGVTLNTYYLDADKDGYGSDATTQKACVPPAGSWVLQGGDCDDNDAARFPGNPEICDGKDNDCNAATPEPGLTTWYQDADGDGYGSNTVSQQSCAKPAGNWVSTSGDCDDTKAAINPGAIELCDGIDNNCINGIDEGPVATYTDADGDGYGSKTATVKYMCEVKPGTAANNTDCDDTKASINPGAVEIPGNGIDENCDGVDTSAGTLCGHDAMSATTFPYHYDGGLTSGDYSTGGPMGTGYYWDDIEISTTAGQTFTILYGAEKPATFSPRLYTRGPNSCTTPTLVSYATSEGSPKGAYFARRVITNAGAGYYYTQLTTATAGQLGNYTYDIFPGNLSASCGNDPTIIWPLGWRKAGTITTGDTEPAATTPVTAGYYADDFEFYLTKGTKYSLLLGGTNFSERIILASAGQCGTQIAASTTGISNGGAKLLYTPTASGIYAAYLTGAAAGLTGSYVFNVVQGDVGNECFAGAGSLGGNGDASVLFPLGGSGSNSLAIGDRAGDFGTRFFDDYETYLEAGDVIAVTMTRGTGTFRPQIRLTRAGACTTSVASATATAGSATVTLNYTVTNSGIYAIVFTSYESSATGSYTFKTSVN